MIARFAASLLMLPHLFLSSSLSTKEYFERIESQTLDVDHRGEHIANEFQLINHEVLYERRTNKHFINNVSPLLISNNGMVEIRYSAHTPEESDWLGAYSPSNADVSKTVPVKFALCKSDPNYMLNGSGVLNFNFTNLRDDVAFHYFTGSLVSPVLVATFEKSLSFKNLNQPLRPRIVPVGTSDRNTFKLLWSSASSETPEVRWGVESGVYDTTISAETGSISRTQMCGKPANSTGWRDLGLTHTAMLTGMLALAGKPLYYIYGDRHTKDFSEEMVFFVPTSQGLELPHRPTKVILYDDMGRGTSDDSYTWNEYGRPSYLTANAVGEEVARGDVDAIYHGGDISYATGYMAVWDFFLNMIGPIAGRVIYLTTVGNHESDFPGTASFYHGTDSGGECGVVATTLIPMPSPASTHKPWWSYDVGLIHFVGMSTEHDYRVGSEQHTWLESDLRTVDRALTPWVVFGGHRAMYVNSAYGENKSASDISVMNLLIMHVEPLLLKYRVNIGFYGHNHVVQRQSAVFNKKVVQRSEETLTPEGEVVHVFRNPQATVHMVIGTAGAGFTENAVTPKPEWNEMFFYKWGYARVVALSSTDLTWEWVESESGTVFDRMALSQVTDFDQHPHWVVSDRDDVAGGENLKEDGARASGGDMDKAYRALFNFFLLGYGIIFIIFLSFVLAWGSIWVCMLSTTDASSPPHYMCSAWGVRRRRGEAYTKLQPSTLLCATVNEEERRREEGRDSESEVGGVEEEQIQRQNCYREII